MTTGEWWNYRDWQRLITRTVTDNDGLEWIWNSGVMWAILPLPSTKKNHEMSDTSLRLYQRAQGNKSFHNNSNADDSAPFSLEAKINKSVFNTWQQFYKFQFIKFHPHFAAPSWLPPGGALLPLLLTIHRYHSLRRRQRRIHISNGVDKFTWFGWKKRLFHLYRQ